MFTAYHAKYAATRLSMVDEGDVAVATSLSAACVDLRPHQVDAAIFALHSPLTRGAILCDEVGLGKTVEAGLVIAQRWAERRRRILLIVPASLRKQWAQELAEKFSLRSVILEARSHRVAEKEGRRPFEPADAVVLTSYEYAASKVEDLAVVAWDLVVFDEAHRLRNVYKASGAKHARALRSALDPRFKLLLTATPLQNSLLELYGLVSMIDGNVFGDEVSFKLLYCGRPGPDTLPNLRDRLAPVFKRHLRRDLQAAGHVAFTQRQVLTLDFEPGDGEVQLYEVVSAYLKRPTVAFGDKPNALVLMVARKILGSSTAATAGLLRRVLERLKAQMILDLDALGDIDDVDGLAAAASETEANPLRKVQAALSGLGSGSGAGAAVAVQGLAGRRTAVPLDPALAAEIDEVEDYLDLAQSIPFNAKGERLVATLPELLDEVERRGGRRKAVIFTESVRTQTYLAAILTANGHAGRIVLLNGSNADPGSARLYEHWKARHAGTPAVSGSRSADMKAAVVEAFGADDATILIATESGAEGMNLQFCSLVVNYDLPWNPQRIEQRIGRCHRYGQRLDVTVINFLNRRNRAEERVYELLRTKFKLFDGVFGASDEILGTIASGVDFERAVLAIVQSCRTDAEIEAGFKELERQLDLRIAADLADARRLLFDHMDQGVIARLKARGVAISRALDEVDRHLMIVARAELPEARFHDSRHHDVADQAARPAGFSFDHAGTTWTSARSTAEERGWRFFCVGDGTLASDLVKRARDRALPIAQVSFTPGALKTLGLAAYADVSRLAGRAGWIRVSCLRLCTLAEAARPREVFVVAAVTDDGEVLDAETVAHLFCVPGKDRGRLRQKPPLARLDALDQAHTAERIRQAQAQNEGWLDEENGKLDAQAADFLRAADAKAGALDAEAAVVEKALRNPGLDPATRIVKQRELKALDAERWDIDLKRMHRRNEFRSAVRDNLDRMAASLAITPELEQLFTVRWSVT